MPGWAQATAVVPSMPAATMLMKMLLLDSIEISCLNDRSVAMNGFEQGAVNALLQSGISL
jgi:hypothetical protein